MWYPRIYVPYNCLLSPVFPSDVPSESQTSNPNSDPFGEFLSSSSTPVSTAQAPSTGNQPVSSAQSDLAGLSTDPAMSQVNANGEVNLFGESAKNLEKQKNTKESILALYGSGGAGGGPQMFGVPGRS